MFQIFFFIAIAESLILFGHYVLYKVLVVFYTIQNPTILLSLKVTLLLLGLSFLVSSVLSQMKYSQPRRYLYIFASVWFGLFTLFFGASCLLTIFYILLAHSGFTYSLSTLASIFFAIAVILDIYGMWNAFHPVVAKVDIGLKNLPEAWVNKKVVFFSDSHFGNINNIAEAKRIVECIKSLSPDLVLMGGDFFDGPPIEFNKIAEEFKSIQAKDGIYIVTGNHESFRDSQVYIKPLEESGMRVLQDEKITIDGVDIVGLSYLTSETDEGHTSLLEKIGISSDRPSILIKHVPVQLELSRVARIDFQLSGHTHKGQMWPFSIITKLMYKGFDYGLHTLEGKDHSLQVYTSSGASTWNPPLRLGTKSEIVFLKFTNRL